jgi:hypothetical protein
MRSFRCGFAGGRTYLDDTGISIEARNCPAKSLVIEADGMPV